MVEGKENQLEIDEASGMANCSKSVLAGATCLISCRRENVGMLNGAVPKSQGTALEPGASTIPRKGGMARLE